jgi:hypothetical protein
MRLAGVTLTQFLKTGLIALLFLILFNWVAKKSNVAGLQSIASAA